MGTSLYDTYRNATRQDNPAGSLYDEYKKSLPAGTGITPGHSKFTAAQLVGRATRQVENAQDAEQVDESTGAARALGTVASLGRDIPGVEAAQAGARSMVRGEPYRDARNEIRGAEDAAPAYTRIPARIAGGGAAAALIPGSPMLAGARYGIASGLLQSDPDADATSRVHDAAVEGAVGAVSGRAAELAGNVARVVGAKTLGKADAVRKALMRSADDVNYGAAAREGSTAAAQGTPPAVTEVLGRADIKPFVDAVRASREFAHADDATVAREVYRQMSKQEGGLLRRMRTQGFDAQLDLQRRNIASAKDELLQSVSSPSKTTRPPITMDVPEQTTAVEGVRLPANRPSLREGIADFDSRRATALQRTEGTPAQQSARQALERNSAESEAAGMSPVPRGPMRADVSVDTPAMRVTTAPAETVQHPPMMPSLPRAISQHAEMAGDRDAMHQGADAARRAINKTSVAGRRLATQSPEAEQAAVRTMTPGRAAAYREGVLGRTKEMMGAFRVDQPVRSAFRAIAAPSRVSPLLRELDQIDPSTLQQLIRAGLISAGTPEP